MSVISILRNRIAGVCLLLLCSGHVFTASAKRAKHKIHDVYTTMTVIHLINTGSYITVSFKRSQMIYRLPRKGNAQYLKLLQYSLEKQTPVIIKRKTLQSDIITGVDSSGKMIPKKINP